MMFPCPPEALSLFIPGTGEKLENIFNLTAALRLQGLPNGLREETGPFTGMFYVCMEIFYGLVSGFTGLFCKDKLHQLQNSSNAT